MKNITVVDARMGRGKSSAAINYMNKNKGAKRFIYITPILTEVERICQACGFTQPDDEGTTKKTSLKKLIYEGKSVASTHALFSMMAEDILEVIRDKGYSLIVDESLSTINRAKISQYDLPLLDSLTTTDDSGLVRWGNPKYNGLFREYKDMSDRGALYRHGEVLLEILNPALLEAFNEVFLLTYMFEGQLVREYLKHFGFQYDIIGVKDTPDGYDFSDGPDCPPPIDYSGLIHIVDNERMNRVGADKFALSKGWYQRHNHGSPEIKTVKKNMHNFFNNMTSGGANGRIWTTFKSEYEKLIPKDNRYSNNYAPLNARATNDFRHTTDVAYMANRFTDPTIAAFFKDSAGEVISEDLFALSELLQFVWRSAIRDGKPINLYVPSRRMRDLLTDWIAVTSEGGSIV